MSETQLLLGKRRATGTFEFCVAQSICFTRSRPHRVPEVLVSLSDSSTGVSDRDLTFGCDHAGNKEQPIPIGSGNADSKLMICLCILFIQQVCDLCVC